MLQLDTTKYLAHPFGVDDALHYVCKAPFFLCIRALPALFFFRSHLEMLCARKRPRQVAFRVSNLLILPAWYALGVAVAVSTL